MLVTAWRITCEDTRQAEDLRKEYVDLLREAGAEVATDVRPQISAADRDVPVQEGTLDGRHVLAILVGARRALG